MYNNQGQVLGAAISVLPATVAYSLVPALHSLQVAADIAVFAGLWAVSYLGISTALRAIKK